VTRYYTKDLNGKIKAWTASEYMAQCLSGEIFETESEIIDYYQGSRIKTELTEEQLDAWARYTKLEQQLQTVENDWQQFLATPQIFTNGKGYLPAWVFDTYPAVLMGFSAGLFTETPIGDATGLASHVETMNQATFTALCTFLQSKWQEGYTAKCLRLEQITNERQQLELVL